MMIRRHLKKTNHYRRHQGTKRYIHIVSDQELSRYRGSLKRFNPRAYPFQNIALWKLRGKAQPIVLTDKWPNFSCTAILQHWTKTLCFPTRNQRYCRLQLLSDSEEDFSDFLHKSKVLEEGAMLPGIDSVTNSHLDNVAKRIFPKWQETPYQPGHYPIKMYYFADNPEVLPIKQRLDSDKYFISKLKPDHADFIADYWLRISKDVAVVRKYFKHILSTVDISVGIFRKSDPSLPVSWAMIGDYGLAISLSTVTQYRQKGLALVALKQLFTQALQQGIVPVGDQRKKSLWTETAVFKYAVERTWRDSITGECYTWIDYI